MTKQKPLTLKDIIKVAEKVKEWEPYEYTCKHSEIFDCDGFEFRGKINGLDIFLEHSARDSLFSDFVRLAIVKDKYLVADTQRIKSKNCPELLNFYKKVEQEYEHKQQKMEGRKEKEAVKNAYVTINKLL